jgi:hypothetical protein
MYLQMYVRLQWLSFKLLGVSIKTQKKNKLHYYIKLMPNASNIIPIPLTAL